MRDPYFTHENCCRSAILSMLALAPYISEKYLYVFGVLSLNRMSFWSGSLKKSVKV